VRSWERARPYETESMFQQHAYGIEEYLRQELTNVLDKIRIVGIAPVKIEADKFFVAVTVRIHASMIDYTARENGTVVSGSRDTPREFTEYWTFARSRAFRPPKGGSRNCPSCGAGLRINMAGHCEFCDAKVTMGEFDWVLARIEQDEAYGG
jgi:inner membrane protein import complex subunit Tim44-like protein